ncbi:MULTISPECIES: hypothetical protein [Edwardsiella]|uniref:Uncharacterized protein n=2 Tax=Edwardsiella anguillarum TaxID=1821960 RepID=A0A076LKQ5_9GAMM|nr:MULTISPECIES: hypothetical protein [Edwardsiella]AIJ07362.1 Hypothetical protein ETEE_0894 [Edwardsiella anguillarum ET080813]UBU94698.1 hypothetical protein AAZ33_19575 [Edwardsiella sp. LADL05-105]UOU78467.1 hypothetical protein MUN71_15725 [Edwardsiella anguillarum]WHP83183.1 hypothetical protein MQ095_15575 [Edwardsiella anguillarum]WHP86977.1 hypothetical protein MQ088_15570 [Edwardsiella anguillarum]
MAQDQNGKSMPIEIGSKAEFTKAVNSLGNLNLIVRSSKSKKNGFAVNCGITKD